MDVTSNINYKTMPYIHKLHIVKSSNINGRIAK